MAYRKGSHASGKAKVKSKGGAKVHGGLANKNMTKCTGGMK